MLFYKKISEKLCSNFAYKIKICWLIKYNCFNVKATYVKTKKNGNIYFKEKIKTFEKLLSIQVIIF